MLCTVKTTVQGGCFFDVVTPSRTYHFQANSKGELMSWLNHIRSASEKVYSELPQSTPQEQAKLIDTNIATVDIRSSQASSLTIDQSEGNLQRIKELRETSNTCADCGAPSKFCCYKVILY